MEPAVKHRYIVRDDRILGGEPIVEGTRTPVRAVAELWRLGLQPGEIVRRLLVILNAVTADEMKNQVRYL
jgi:uncharacterized protein (DUF433 family)